MPSLLQDDYVVHTIKPAEPDVVQGAVTVDGFALGGKRVEPDAANCLAKRAKDCATSIERYWLKRATTGNNAGKLYNPNWPIHDSKAEYAFVKATKEAFDSYVRFLETDNPLFLHQAERA